MKATPLFTPGQRWLSDTEPELGLGLVIETNNRTVRLLFPASGDMREYAAGNSPLRRAHFAVGDQITDQQGATHTVRAIEENHNCMIYLTDAGPIPEAALGDTLSIDRPEQRLAAGQIDEPAWFQLRRSTHTHRHHVQGSNIRGYLGARIELLPHQLYIAHTVSNRLAPRVLLADEVGLGKTIEACLILHRLHLQGRASRILIIVPQPLVHQWFVELYRRFNLEFRILGGSPLSEGHAQESSLGEAERIICPQEQVSRDPELAASILAETWDLLIIDEAHHLAWTPDDPSPEYRIAEALAARIPALLLLTASPEQTGLESHFARLRLLDPHRYPNLDAFRDEYRNYEKVADQATSRIETCSSEELRTLLDRHGPGRVLFRNTRAAVGTFPKRIPHLIPLDADPSTPPLTPQALWLAQFLRNNPTTKALVICRTRDEVESLAESIQQRIQLKIAQFHEEMSILQCDRQAAWFAEESGARILIASEIGGEGRNFQFIHHLVLIDLPAEAEALEQRIGRLDRIGQTRDIHIHVPYIKGSPEAQRVRWLHDALDAFATPTCGAWELEHRFAAQMHTLDNSTITAVQEAHTKLKRQMETGRDRLLELNSCRPAEAEALIAQIKEWDSSSLLPSYMEQLFDRFGVGIEHLREHEQLLKPEHLFFDEFPLPRDGLRITFNRDYALCRPDVTLLSWDHPLVESAMDLLLSSERGSCTLLQSSHIDHPCLYALFILDVIGAGNRPSNHFLPPTPIDITIDHTRTPSPDILDTAAPAPHWRIDSATDLRNTFVPQALQAARHYAEAEAERITQTARQRAKAELHAEYARICHLARENDSVRADEIELAATLVTETDQALAGAQLRLDAIALILPA